MARGAKESRFMMPMKPLGKTRAHFWMAQRMARLHGVDLAAAQARGDLEQALWAGMVRRCRGCAWTAGCRRYLDRGTAAQGLPAACLNRAEFAALASP